MSRTHETFWWALFSAGGVVAAFVVPAMIFLTGLAGPSDWSTEKTAFGYDQIKTLLSHPLVKLFLLVSVSLPLFHCFHRIRHIFCDIGLGVTKTKVSWVFYLPAFVGTVICAILLWQV